MTYLSLSIEIKKWKKLKKFVALVTYSSRNGEPTQSIEFN